MAEPGEVLPRELLPPLHFALAKAVKVLVAIGVGNGWTGLASFVLPAGTR